MEDKSDPAGGEIRVLIVDDHSMVRQGLRMADGMKSLEILAALEALLLGVILPAVATDC